MSNVFSQNFLYLNNLWLFLILWLFSSYKSYFVVFLLLIAGKEPGLAPFPISRVYSHRNFSRTINLFLTCFHFASFYVFYKCLMHIFVRNCKNLTGNPLFYFKKSSLFWEIQNSINSKMRQSGFFKLLILIL